MTLIVGVDPGHRSVSVLHLAAMLARSAGTDLVVAAVLPKTWPLAAGRADAEWRSYTRDAANLVLDHAAAVLGGSVPAEFLLHEATSARRGLAELAEQRDATLIVIGSAAEGPVGRIALGAESDALLHAAPVPVAIAPRGFRTGQDARVVRVTAAYRGTDESEDLVRGAAGVAASVGAELRIASFAVVPPGSATSGAGLDVEQGIADQWVAEVEDHAARVLSEVSARPDAPRIAGAVVGMGEDWASAMNDVAWESGEVLVVGSSSLGAVARVFLGSHATKVVRHSPVPVVVVPRGAAIPEHV